MHGKKGFTLIEVLVVIVVIAIISLLAFPSYMRGRVTTQNEMARAKLVEVANAARMYNEDNRGDQRIAGGFGDQTVSGFLSPVRLFVNAGNVTSTFRYLKSTEWNTSGAGVYHYRGYKFYVCNPDSTSASFQPSGSGCTGSEIATMLGPVSPKIDTDISDDAITKYGGKKWWVSKENLGTVGSNYGG